MKTVCLVRAFEWHKRFSEGRESLKDDDRPGRPRTAVTEDNENVRDVIRKERKLGIRAVAEEVNLDRESVRRILKEELNMRNFCAKMVPKLSDEQKECRKEMCLDLLQRIENEPDLLNSIITCDETWLFTYDPETKRQSIQWKSTSSPRPKKSTHVSFEVQVMLIVCFDNHGILMGTQRPDGKSAVIHRSLDEIA